MGQSPVPQFPLPTLPAALGGDKKRRNLYFMANSYKIFQQCSSEPSTCNMEKTESKIFLRSADREIKAERKQKVVRRARKDRACSRANVGQLSSSACTA